MITFNDNTKTKRVVVPTTPTEIVPLTIGNDSFWNDINIISSTTALYAHRSDITAVNFTNLTTVSEYGMVWTFSNCYALQTVDFPALTTVASYGMGEAFTSCPSLRTVNFAALSTIGTSGMRNIFENCSTLQEVNFPSLTTIAWAGLRSAFKNCKFLSSINFPNLTTLGYEGLLSAFIGCASLKTISFPVLKSFGGYAMQSAFHGCSSLESVNFPELVSINGFDLYNAFNYCSSVQTANFPKVSTISNYGMGNAFFDCYALQTFNLPKLTSLSSYAMQNTFYECSSLQSANFPELTTIGSSAMTATFEWCTSLSSVSFPKLTTISLCGMSDTFRGCVSLHTANFPELTTIGNSGMYGTFTGCKSLTVISFPKLSTIGTNGMLVTFSSCTSLSEIHVPAALSGVYDPSVIYGSAPMGSSIVKYDIGNKLTLNPNVPLNVVIDNGKVKTGNGDLYPITGTPFTYFAYADGYCLYEGSFTATQDGNYTQDITLTTQGTTYSVNSANAETITFKLNGVTLGTYNSSSKSIIVPAGSSYEIEWIASREGYKSQSGVLNSSNPTVNITDWEEQTARIATLSYPFTEDSEYLANLVDGNNFIISSDSTKYGNAIVTGPKSYNINNGYSTGYIEFTTPDTDDTELLTLSMQVTNYAESSYDYGLVFLSSTNATVPTSNTAITSAVGTVNATYGEILFQGYSNQSSSYRTVTKVLQKNTTYWLKFYYRKDGSANSDWDRFCIKEIKLPITV